AIMRLQLQVLLRPLRLRMCQQLLEIRCRDIAGHTVRERMPCRSAPCVLAGEPGFLRGLEARYGGVDQRLLPLRHLSRPALELARHVLRLVAAPLLGSRCLAARSRDLASRLANSSST